MTLNSVYLTGWEYNRIAAADPFNSVASGLPAQCLWEGAAQFFLFETVYCTKESFDGDLAAADDLGWTTGYLFKKLRDEGILRPVDLQELAEKNPALGIEYQHRADELKTQITSGGLSAMESIENLIKNGAYDDLEGIKAYLLAPILKELNCANNISPNSVRHWFTGEERRPDSQNIIRALVAPLREGRQRIRAGVELCNKPGHGLDQEVLEAQRVEEKTRQAPLIPALLSGCLAQNEYHDALRPGLDAYTPINRQLFNEFQSNFENILRLRELAQKHLWNDLHTEWIPQLVENGGYIKEFQGLVNRSLRHARFDSLLKRSSDLAFGKSMPIAAAALSGIVSTALNAPPEVVAGTAGIVGVAAELAGGIGTDAVSKAHGKVDGLVQFYQKA